MLTTYRPNFGGLFLKMWMLALMLATGLVSAQDKAGWMKSLKTLDEVRSQNSDSNDFVETVHVIFMNHLDVGYAKLANNILNDYFQTFYPRAIAIATQLEQDGYVEKLVYTTHPWLVSLYLDCLPNLVLAGIKLQCPSEAQKAAFINAVKKGYINWHAGPMNLQIEMAEPWLFEFGIDLSVQLDARFNITRAHRALSQRDVPGMTVAAVPSLKKKGVIGVTVGVNNMTPPPAVPTLFRWQYGKDSVLGTWHKGGYPDNPGPNPAHPKGLSRHDCAVVEGFKDALCFSFRTDNSGPPESVGEVLTTYEILRAEFPNAQLKASNLETFFEAALAIQDQLPILTNEISDTWIQGVSSDPRKCAEYRAVSRVMRQCIAAGKCQLTDARVWNSSRLLVKLPEHTWGLYSENDQSHWSNPDFYPLRKTAQNFINITKSWIEQREFTYLAIDALQDHPVVKDIKAEMAHLIAKQPDLTNFVQVPETSTVFTCPSGNIKALQFGSDGSIIKLNFNNIDWADSGHALSSFVYNSFDEKDFDDFGRVYNYNGHSAGYYKPNVTKCAHPESKVWAVSIASLFKNKGAECDFYVSVQLMNHTAVTYYGAPNTVWIRYTVRKGDATNPGIDLDFQWFDKTITRLPEALSLAFKPIPQSNYKWSVSKMDKPVDPTTVLLNGSQYQHVVWDKGVTYFGKNNPVTLQLLSPDVPLVCMLTGTRLDHIFPIPLQPIPDITGVAFNIYNNIWDTNWIMWYPFVDVVGDQGVLFAGQGWKYFMRLQTPDVPLATVLTGGDMSHVFPAPLGPLSDKITGMAFNIYNNIWETNYIMWYPYTDNDENFRARFAIEFINTLDD